MPEPRASIRRTMKQGTVALFAALAAGLLLFPLAPKALAQQPADRADVDRLRRQLDRMESGRRATLENLPFPWEHRPRPFELDHEQLPDDAHAVVELHYAARGISSFVKLTSLDSPEAPPIHAPMLVPGSQWIRVKRGNWRVELLAGYVTGPVIAFPSARVEIKGGKVYRLTFGPDEEVRARDLAREESERLSRASRMPGVSVSP